MKLPKMKKNIYLMHHVMALQMYLVILKVDYENNENWKLLKYYH